MNRRELLKAAVALAALGLPSGAEAKKRRKSGPKEEFWRKPLPPEAQAFAQELAALPRGEAHEKQNTLVRTEELLREKLPVPDPERMLGSKRGLVVSKRFHRFWLFDEGKLVAEGPIGSAFTAKGYETPEGLFAILREEGENYSSGEYPPKDPQEPNMPWAVFFTPKGHAFHGAPGAFRHFRLPDEAGEKRDVEFLHLDRSHGCVNARVSDAELVNRTLERGDPVLILP